MADATLELRSASLRATSSTRSVVSFDEASIISTSTRGSASTNSSANTFDYRPIPKKLSNDAGDVGIGIGNRDSAAISFGSARDIKSGTIIHRAESLDVTTAHRDASESISTFGNSTATDGSTNTFQYRPSALKQSSYDTGTSPVATAASSSASSAPTLVTSNKRANRLTAISRMYDLDGDGVLDEVEQIMRDCDVTGRGYLTSTDIKCMVDEKLKTQKEIHNYKRAAVVLICLMAILALSNFGTSWASAILASDTVADSESGTILSKKSKEVMGLQEVAFTAELEQLSDDEFEARRQLVDREMAHDPDHEDHHHRKLGPQLNNKCTCSKIGYDHGKIKERQLLELTRKCDSSNTVNIKRKWKNLNTGGYDVDYDTICGPGTVIIKKGKRKRNKKKTKVKVVDTQIKFRKNGGGSGKDKEISFDCDNNGYW